jgi:hypothetical protein
VPSGDCADTTNPAASISALYIGLNSYLWRCRSCTIFSEPSICPHVLYTCCARLPARTTHGYVPSRIFHHLVCSHFWCSMICTILCSPSGENSSLFASAICRIFRAYSIAMIWLPRHIPRYGILCSRAYCAVRIMPSIPRVPNPPGTHIASIHPNISSISCVFSISSASIKCIFTFF